MTRVVLDFGFDFGFRFRFSVAAFGYVMILYPYLLLARCSTHLDPTFATQ